MPEVTLSPELRQRVERLAQALLSARRALTLYPSDHPAARAGLDRLHDAVADATGGVGLTLGVTPTTLLVAGAPAADNVGPVAEAAVLLHAADILEITFAGEVPRSTLRALVELVTTPPDALRRGGGPATIWNRGGHASVAIVQVDYEQILQDRGAVRAPVTKDELWRAIVRAATTRRASLDEAMQQRLLAIAGDVEAIGELARDAMAPARMPDGSPLITTQAAAVLAVYRHLTATVAVLDPDRRAALLRNLAAATAQLEPRVAHQILTTADESEEGGVAELAAAFDDDQVAQLLATTLALDGQATPRLEQVFETLAPDAERKRRVLRLARDRLSEGAFGQRSRFEALWTSVEELLIGYTERPFVSAGYRAALDATHARASALAAVDLPPEATQWFQTLEHDNVRRLSVTLLIDLLNLETQADRADDLAHDLASLGDDLLMAGEYELAGRVVEALSVKAADRSAVAAAASRAALDRMASSAALRETLDLVAALDDAQTVTLAALCRTMGPPVVDALLPVLAREDDARARAWATAVVVELGPPAVGRLAPLVADHRSTVQLHAAAILGRIGAAEAVPLLQALLRSSDPRVAREAVRALAGIDDPSAARAIHTVLRASSGAVRRAVVAALVAERDPRVVPVLLRILAESQVFRADHAVVLEALDALGTLGRDEAVGTIGRLMHRRSLWRWRRARELRRRALGALRTIGTPAALAAIEDAARTGDRMLRRLARRVMP